jgi:Asp-tRNA(Asn)/Glu-tRNA(Gln) amidotransferase C subunit
MRPFLRSVRSSALLQRYIVLTPIRTLTATRSPQNEQSNTSDGHVDVDALLSKPTWSVSSLLPPKESSPDSPPISSKQLHHLLRLSALPPPKDEQEEAEMLKTLSSQLHFVKEIQKVDTTGVEPFRSLRDETEAGEKEAELGLDALKEALAQEDVRGKYHKRIRRRRAASQATASWDPLQTAQRKVGRYFVVEGGKEQI